MPETSFTRPKPDLTNPRPTPAPSYADVLPTYRGPQFIGSSGEPTDVRPDSSIFTNIGDRYLVGGYGTSGLLGIGNIPSIQGLVSRGAAMSMVGNRDSAFERKINPHYNPIPDPELDTLKGSDYYARSMTLSEKRILDEAGYGADNFARFNTAREAKDFHGYALLMTRSMQSMSSFNDNRGGVAGATAWLGNFGLEILTDPTNLIALGISGAAKAVGKTAVAKLVAEAGKAGVARIGGTALTERVAAALTTRTAQALVTGTMNAAQYSIQANAADRYAEQTFKLKPGEFETNYTPDGAAISAGLGAGLSVVLSYALGRHTSPHTAKDLDASIPSTPMVAEVKTNYADATAVAEAMKASHEAATVSGQMKRLVNNETFMAERWAPEKMAEYNSVVPDGDASKALVSFLKENPTPAEIHRWFETADRLLAEKNAAVPDAAGRTIPDSLKADKPRWGFAVKHAVSFESPIDQSLYRITQTLKPDQLREHWAFLRRYSGLTDDQIKLAAIAVNQEVAGFGRILGHKGEPGQIHVTNMFDKPDVIVPTKMGEFTKPVPPNVHPLEFPTAASKAADSLEGLQHQLKALESSPEVSTPAVQKKIRSLRRKIGPLNDDILTAKSELNGPAGVELRAPEAKTGLLDDKLAYQELDRTLDPHLVEDTYADKSDGPVENQNAVFRLFQKTGKKILGTGWDEVVSSNSPIVRHLGSMIDEGGLLARSYGSAKQYALSLQARLHQAKANAALSRKAVRDVYTKHNLSPEERALISKHVWYSTAGRVTAPIADVRLKAAFNEAKVAYKGYLDRLARDGMESRYFSDVTPDYVNTVIKQNEKHKVNEIGQIFYQDWLDRWLDPGAELHVGTLKKIGLIAPDGKEVRRGFGYDELLDAPDSKGIRFITDLKPEHRAQYLENLKNPNKDEGALAFEAFTAAQRKTGNYVTAEPDGPIRGVKADPKKARTMKREVYFLKPMEKYMETDLETLIDNYGDSTAYRIGRHRSVNDLTGRRDISWQQLLEWGQSRALRNLKDADDRKAITEAFEIIRDKERFLDRSLPSPPETLKALEVGATAMIDLARVGVSARNALQQVLSEWAPALLRGGGLSPTAIKNIVGEFLNLKDVDALHGMYYLLEETKTHATRMMYDVDPHVQYSYGWTDRAIKNPIARVKQVEGVGNTINAITNGLAEVSKAVSLEDASNIRTRIMASAAERTKFARHWKAIQKLSAALEENRAALEAAGVEERRSLFIGLARKAGFGADHYYAARLNQAGLLHPDAVNSLGRMDNHVKGMVSDFNRGRSLLYKDMVTAATKENDIAVQRAMQNTTDRMLRFLETQVDAQVVRPGVWDLRTDPGSRSPYGRLQNAFMSWGRAWYNKRMVDTIGNNRLHHSLGILGMTVLSEVLWGVLNKLLYQGYTAEDIAAEWEDNPALQTSMYASRVNFMGGWQSMAFQIADSIWDFDGRPTSNGAPYPVVAATGALKSAGKAIHAAFSEDVELSHRDVDKLNRITPVLSSPFLQALAKATGYKSLGEMFTEGFTPDH